MISEENLGVLMANIDRKGLLLVLTLVIAISFFCRAIGSSGKERRGGGYASLHNFSVNKTDE